MNREDHRLDDFFMKYRNVVFRSVYKTLQDYHAAEDITQETFIRLGENLDKVSSDHVLRWLIRVSRHLTSDYMKRGGNVFSEVSLEELSDEDLVDESCTDVSDMLVKKEALKEKCSLFLEMRKKRPDWYDALYLSYLEDMDNDAAAKVLGITANLFCKWKDRGRRWLVRRNEEYKKGR